MKISQIFSEQISFSAEINPLISNLHNRNQSFLHMGTHWDKIALTRSQKPKPLNLLKFFGSKNFRQIHPILTKIVNCGGHQLVNCGDDDPVRS